MSIKVNEIKVKSILNKTNVPIGDYVVNPYVGCAHGCKYCYTSFMKRFTNWEALNNELKAYAKKEINIKQIRNATLKRWYDE